MARQYLQEGPYLDPPIAAPLSADATTTILAMWNPLQYTKFYGDEARPGRVYVVKAGGVLTTTTSGTLTITPAISTPAAATGGTTLGASIANTVPGTIMTAAAWILDSYWVVRTIGAPGGNNATMIGEGLWHTTSLGTASNAPLTVVFGGTSAAFDQSGACAMNMQKTMTVGGTWTTHWCLGYWMN